MNYPADAQIPVEAFVTERNVVWKDDDLVGLCELLYE